MCVAHRACGYSSSILYMKFSSPEFRGRKLAIAEFGGCKKADVQICTSAICVVIINNRDLPHCGSGGSVFIYVIYSRESAAAAGPSASPVRPLPDRRRLA